MTPARRHFERVRAEREARTSSAPIPPEEKRLHTTIRNQMTLHTATLKRIQSTQAKIEKKRTFLPEYAAWVDGVLAANSGAQDDVLITVMIWRLDAGDFDGALQIAEYALRHNLAMPARFHRDLATCLVEEIAEAVKAHSPAEEEVLIPALSRALVVTADRDMPDEVRAKGHKALGRLLAEREPGQAIHHLETAQRFHPGCGVKTELERLKKQCADSEAQTEALEPAS